jgi:hypothetical protein
MPVVVLIGADDALGRRVRARLDAERDVRRVVVVDGELTSPDLKATFEGAGAVVHLLPGVAETRAVLDAAGDAGVEHVVLLSSATVYGAWANNPVPLTEEAPLRPNPGVDVAVEAAERERLAQEWRFSHPSASLTLLRPTVAAAEDATREPGLAHDMRSARRFRVADDDSAAQYLHLDDLASAVVHAVRERLDGPFNVAPDGWIGGDQLRALLGGWRWRLPRRVARRLAGPLLPYATHPWVIANDKLRAAGWSAEHSNDEAVVAGHRPSPWATISPRRRQELALAGAGVAVAGSVAVAVVALLRRRARRA